MKKNLRASHRGKAVEFRMAAIPADHERANDPVDFEERQLVPAAAIPLLIAASHMDLRVFVHNGSLGGDDMGQVQVTIRGLAQRSGDYPNTVRLGGLAGSI